MTRANESSLTLSKQLDDMDTSASTSSVEKSSSLENISTQSNPSFWTKFRWSARDQW